MLFASNTNLPDCRVTLLRVPRHGGRLKQNPNQAFSTCPNSNSTGVARPKIVTDTRTRDFS